MEGVNHCDSLLHAVAECTLRPCGVRMSPTEEEKRKKITSSARVISSSAPVTQSAASFLGRLSKDRKERLAHRSLGDPGCRLKRCD